MPHSPQALTATHVTIHMYLAISECMQCTLYACHLCMCRFDLGSGAAVIRSTSPVTLNEWHDVRAQRASRAGKCADLERHAKHKSTLKGLPVCECKQQPKHASVLAPPWRTTAPVSYHPACTFKQCPGVVSINGIPWVTIQ